MKTFALVQGDLSPAAGGFLLYSGVKKIEQDLTLAFREAYGGDALHPRWGSILPEFIGVPLTADVKQQIIAEATRVVNNYITVQNARIAQDNVNNNASSLTTDDIVGSLAGVSVQQSFDSIILTVSLFTVSRQQVTISQVIG